MRLTSRFAPKAKAALFCLSVLAVAVKTTAIAHTALVAAGPPAVASGSSPFYTMTSTTTCTPAGGIARTVSTQVHRQRPDGLFCVVTTYRGGAGSPAGVVTTSARRGWWSARRGHWRA